MYIIVVLTLSALLCRCNLFHMSNTFASLTVCYRSMTSTCIHFKSTLHCVHAVDLWYIFVSICTHISPPDSVLDIHICYWYIIYGVMLYFDLPCSLARHRPLIHSIDNACLHVNNSWCWYSILAVIEHMINQLLIYAYIHVPCFQCIGSIYDPRCTWCMFHTA